MRTLFLVLLLTTALFSQDAMNPDGYIGGLTLQGFMYFDDAESDFYIEDDNRVGKITYENETDFVLKAKVPFHRNATITIYYNYRAYDGIFQPNTLGRTIGYMRDKSEFSNTTFGVGLTVYIKKLF